jgi:hypothetical protein
MTMIIKPELNPTWSDNAVEWILTKIFIPIDWIWEKLEL